MVGRPEWVSVRSNGKGYTIVAYGKLRGFVMPKHIRDYKELCRINWDLEGEVEIKVPNKEEMFRVLDILL